MQKWRNIDMILMSMLQKRLAEFARVELHLKEDQKAADEKLDELAGREKELDEQAKALADARISS